MLKQSVKSGGEATENFCRFARRTVEASSRKKGTKDNLYSTIRLLEKFNKSVTFEELTQGFLQSFEQYVAKQNFLPNTITKHLRNIRTLVNEGIRAGYLKQSQYPFVGFKLHKEKTKHRNLTDEEVEKLEQLSLKGRDEKVRDAFLFCCYTGLRYSDFVALRVEHLCSINNATWLVFDSQKTGQKTRVPIEKIFGGKAMAILDKYKLERFVDIGSNSRVNAALHRITEAAGIAQHVSFHMARHTCATMLIRRGIPITTIQRILGHTNVRTTEIYAETGLDTIEKSIDGVW
jgi:site-specific recombinase XerD